MVWETRPNDVEIANFFVIFESITAHGPKEGNKIKLHFVIIIVI